VEGSVAVRVRTDGCRRVRSKEEDEEDGGESESQRSEMEHRGKRKEG